MKRARKIAYGLVALMMSASMAMAADIAIVDAPPATPPPPPAVTFDWAGPYAGVTGGIGVMPDYGIGPYGGVLAGFLVQRDRLVFGIEADANLGWAGVNPQPVCTDPTENCTNSEFPRYVGTNAHLRAIAGFAPGDRVMLFLSGGLAVANFVAGAFSEAAGGGETDFDEDLTSILTVGWSMGAGGEVRLQNGLRVRGEVLFDRLPMLLSWSNSSSATVTCCFSAALTNNIDYQLPWVTSIRLGLIWDF